MTVVLAQAVQRTDWHLAAAVLLGILTLLVLVVIVVEIAVWRRFREIKALFQTAFNIGKGFDTAFHDLRKADEDSSDKIEGLRRRVDEIDVEVHRLATFHPPGAAHEKR